MVLRTGDLSPRQFLHDALKGLGPGRTEAGPFEAQGRPAGARALRQAASQGVRRKLMALLQSHHDLAILRSDGLHARLQGQDP